MMFNLKEVEEIVPQFLALHEGNYRYSVSDGRCRSASSADVVINDLYQYLGGGVGVLVLLQLL
jgi:hypothetical protein